MISSESRIPLFGIVLESLSGFDGIKTGLDATNRARCPAAPEPADRSSRPCVVISNGGVHPMTGVGGYLWLMITVVGVAALAAGLIYGIVMWRNRNRSPGLKRRRDEATRELYQRSSRE
jgi:hypothetical protein